MENIKIQRRTALDIDY